MRYDFQLTSNNFCCGCEWLSVVIVKNSNFSVDLILVSFLPWQLLAVLIGNSKDLIVLLDGSNL